jgi:hypothetical protein
MNGQPCVNAKSFVAKKWRDPPRSGADDRAS